MYAKGEEYVRTRDLLGSHATKSVVQRSRKSEDMPITNSRTTEAFISQLDGENSSPQGEMGVSTNANETVELKYADKHALDSQDNESENLQKRSDKRSHKMEPKSEKKGMSETYCIQKVETLNNISVVGSSDKNNNSNSNSNNNDNNNKINQKQLASSVKHFASMHEEDVLMKPKLGIAIADYHPSPYDKVREGSIIKNKNKYSGYVRTREGGCRPLRPRATKKIISEKNMQNALKRKNMYLEGFRIFFRSLKIVGFPIYTEKNSF